MSGTSGVEAAGPLPFTGGIFTVPIMILGLLLTLSAFVVATVRKVRGSRS
jgi:LPXTG-motif cell wall-anchored protein